MKTDVWTTVSFGSQIGTRKSTDRDTNKVEVTYHFYFSVSHNFCNFFSKGV